MAYAGTTRRIESPDQGMNLGMTPLNVPLVNVTSRLQVNYQIDPASNVLRTRDGLRTSELMHLYNDTEDRMRMYQPVLSNTTETSEENGIDYFQGLIRDINPVTGSVRQVVLTADLTTRSPVIVPYGYENAVDLDDLPNSKLVNFPHLRVPTYLLEPTINARPMRAAEWQDVSQTPAALWNNSYFYFSKTPYQPTNSTGDLWPGWTETTDNDSKRSYLVHTTLDKNKYQNNVTDVDLHVVAGTIMQVSRVSASQTDPRIDQTSGRWLFDFEWESITLVPGAVTVLENRIIPRSSRSYLLVDSITAVSGGEYTVHCKENTIIALSGFNINDIQIGDNLRYITVIPPTTSLGPVSWSIVGENYTASMTTLHSVISWNAATQSMDITINDVPQVVGTDPIDIAVDFIVTDFVNRAAIDPAGVLIDRSPSGEGHYIPELVELKQPTPNEAMQIGFNLLLAEPYAYTNTAGITLTDTWNTLGLIAYDTNGNVLTHPVTGQGTIFKVFFEAPLNKKYRWKMEWRTSGSSIWTLIKQGDIGPWDTVNADLGTDQLAVPFTPPVPQFDLQFSVFLWADPNGNPYAVEGLEIPKYVAHIPDPDKDQFGLHATGTDNSFQGSGLEDLVQPDDDDATVASKGIPDSDNDGIPDAIDDDPTEVAEAASDQYMPANEGMRKYVELQRTGVVGITFVSKSGSQTTVPVSFKTGGGIDDTMTTDNIVEVTMTSSTEVVVKGSHNGFIWSGSRDDLTIDIIAQASNLKLYTRESTGIPSDYEPYIIPEQVYPASFTFNKTASGTSEDAALAKYKIHQAGGMTYWNHRLVCWNVPGDDNQNMLFCSHLDDPSWFPMPGGVDYFDEAIRFCAALGEQLLVFTKSMIYVLMPEELGWSKQVVHRNLHIEKGDERHVIAIRNMLFFKSGKYYYMVVPTQVGGLTVAPISKPITEMLERWYYEDDDPSQFTTIEGSYDGRERSFVREIVEELYDLRSGGWPIHPEEGRVPITFVQDYSFFDFDSVHVRYVFQIKDVWLNIDLCYNTTTRIWNIECFESERQRVIPHVPDVTKRGQQIALHLYDEDAQRYDLQLLTFMRTRMDDFYIKQNFNVESATEAPHVGFTKVFANWQLLDTGLRDLGSDFKRFREFNLRMTNDNQKTGLRFKTEFWVDGVDRNRRQYRYHVREERSPDGKSAELVVVPQEMPRSLLVGATTLGVGRLDPTEPPTKDKWNQGDTDGTDIFPGVIGDDFSTNFEYENPHEISRVDRDFWTLGLSGFPEQIVYKVRVKCGNTKGAHPRFRLVSQNEKEYQIYGYRWIFKPMYGRMKQNSRSGSETR